MFKKRPNILGYFCRKNTCFLHKKKFSLMKNAPKFWAQILDDFVFYFFEAELEGKLEAKLWTSFLSFLRLRGALLRGALGRAPPPFCRAEILEKFSGKSVLETILYFLGEKTD